MARKVTVVTDYDRESTAVFVDKIDVYGCDPYNVDITELLRAVLDALNLSAVRIVEEGTYGRPYEFFEKDPDAT